MTIYTIAVNGKSYDVTVQKKREISDASVSVAKDDAASVTIPINPVSATGTAASQFASAAGGDAVRVVAPMPGRIIEIKVQAGNRVKIGQVLIVMETMKMHNSVLAASEGIISELFVKVNDTVQSGQSLLSIR